MTILHVCLLDKFIPPFIEFINNNFDNNKHLFLVYGDNVKHPYKASDNIKFISGNLKYIHLSYEMNKAKKIIFHGFFDRKLMCFIFFQQWLLKKSYWVMWGGDLYTTQYKESTMRMLLNKSVSKYIKGRFHGYITFIRGDYELAKKLYGAKGKYYECIMYLSNLYKELKLPVIEKQNKTVLVGNSSDPENNHEEILEKLIKLSDQQFNIICPLSYGNNEHAKKIAEKGKEMFGDRFTPLTDFMPFNEYLKVLADVDIAIFAHNRQQAMGNTITLLGLGKTVYLRSDITPFAFYEELDIYVRNINTLDFELLDEMTMSKNKKNVKRYFSKPNLIRQLDKIFEGEYGISK